MMDNRLDDEFGEEESPVCIGLSLFDMYVCLFAYILVSLR